jgi:hypothetical protein
MPKWDRVASAILAMACLTGVAAACSSSGGHPAPTVAPPPTTAVSPTTGPTAPTSGASGPTSGPSSSAEAEVRTNWTTFFTGTTPAATRIALLQNGASLASYIEAQANSSLAKSVSVTVRNVQITSDTATVSYDLDLAGQIALPGQTGTAVLEGGTWKVSDASFCGLLAIEGQHPPGCPG